MMGKRNKYNTQTKQLNIYNSTTKTIRDQTSSLYPMKTLYKSYLFLCIPGAPYSTIVKLNPHTET